MAWPVRDNVANSCFNETQCAESANMLHARMSFNRPHPLFSGALSSQRVVYYLGKAIIIFLWQKSSVPLRILLSFVICVYKGHYPQQATLTSQVADAWWFVSCVSSTGMWMPFACRKNTGWGSRRCRACRVEGNKGISRQCLAHRAFLQTEPLHVQTKLISIL